MSDTNKLSTGSVAFELVLRGGTETVAFVCPTCGAVFTLRKEQLPGPAREAVAAAAVAHCVPRRCPCGQLIEDKYYTRCRGCREEAERQKEQRHFEKAEKLTIEAYDGPLYWEGHSASLGDGYFADAEELLGYCEDEEVDVPPFVWACSPHEFTLDGERFLANELERQEMYEGVGEDITDDARRKLREFLDAWVKERDLRAWGVDYSRAVLLHPDGAPEGGVL
jgi:hypothetical protein